MEHREFKYVGDENLNLTENAEFILEFQKAILIALEKKQLLTRMQRERCYEMIENRQLSKGQKTA